MRLGRLFLLAAVALVVWAAAAPAQAAPRRVAVLRFTFDGRVPEVARVTLSQRLVESLAAAGFEVSAGEVLKNALRRMTAPEACQAAGCYREIAGRLGVDYLVVGEVSARQKNYDVRLELVAGGQGARLVEKKDRCELCGLAEVGELVGRLAASLHGALVATPEVAAARLQVLSQPAGAAVSLDGEAAGVAPVVLELRPGSHQIVVAPTGGAPGTALGPGAESAGSPASARPRDPWARFGWANLLVGALAVAGGIFALQFDGREVPCEPGMQQPGQRCVQHTQLLSGALFGVGGAALVGGGLILLLSRGGAASRHDARGGSP